MASEVIETIERDGFEGTVYENDEGRQFVSWHLANLSTARRGSVRITGITGRKGSPKAAAYNLQHSSSRGFLMRVLRSRIQVGNDGAGGVQVQVPGAQIQGVGYDEPMDLTLVESVAGTGDLSLALRLMADTIANTTARGVYAKYNQAGAEEARGEEGVGDIIEF